MYASPRPEVSCRGGVAVPPMPAKASGRAISLETFDGVHGDVQPVSFTTTPLCRLHAWLKANSTTGSDLKTMENHTWLEPVCLSVCLCVSVCVVCVSDCLSEASEAFTMTMS